MAATTHASDGDFETFATTARPRALRLAAAMTRDRGAAEDAVAHAMAGVWSRWDDRTVHDPWAYLVASIRNHVVDTARAAGRREAALARHGPAPAILSDEADTADLREELRTALATLSPAQQHAVALRHVVGHSALETAVLLDVAPGTARSRVSRGLSQLRRALSSPD